MTYKLFTSRCKMSPSVPKAPLLWVDWSQDSPGQPTMRAMQPSALGVRLNYVGLPLLLDGLWMKANKVSYSLPF